MVSGALAPSLPSRFHTFAARESAAPLEVLEAQEGERVPDAPNAPLVLGVTSAVAQYTPACWADPQPEGCPSSGNVDVYLNVDTISLYEKILTRYEQALLEVLAVWNGRSHADINLEYRGRTSDTKKGPNTLVVDFIESFFCDTRACPQIMVGAQGVSNCSGEGAFVQVVLRDCVAPPGWSAPPGACSENNPYGPWVA